MVARPELEVAAALVLAWRRDDRALPILERELTLRGGAGAYNLNRAPGPMVGRLGAPGRAVLAQLLTRAVAAQPEPPPAWSAPDRLLRGLLDRPGGRTRRPDP